MFPVWYNYKKNLLGRISVKKRFCSIIFVLIFGLILFNFSNVSKADVRVVPYVTIKVSAAGDCTLATDPVYAGGNSFDNKVSEVVKSVDDYNYFLSGVSDIFSNDDLTIVNMEGTLSTNGTRQDKTYAFRGNPEYVNVLTQGSVEACNFANNHCKDYGEISYTDTISILDDAGITNFGLDRVSLKDVNGIKVGLVGIYELPYGIKCMDNLLSCIEQVKNQGAELIIVSFHWGIEREYYPEEIQINLAHAAIDNGADLVLGHHPHVLQGLEEYKGKFICYSLGNFCFGGNKNPSDKDSGIFTQTFTFYNRELVTGKVSTGLSYRNACLQNSGENGIFNLLDRKDAGFIPCRVSSRTDLNDYHPVLLEGEEGQKVLDKVNERSVPYL